MYVETTRKISEREAERLRKQIGPLKDEIKDVPKSTFCCLGCMSPIALVIFYSNRTDPYIWWEILGFFVVLGLIAAAAGLERAEKSRKSLQSLEGAIEKGVAIESHIVTTRCFKIDGDDAGDDYYFDVGDQGTLAINDLEIDSRRFPNSDFKATRLFDSEGKLIDVINRAKGEKLSPVETFDRDDLWNSPELERFLYMKSFTLLPEDFETLLRILTPQPE